MVYTEHWTMPLLGDPLYERLHLKNHEVKALDTALAVLGRLRETLASGYGCDDDAYEVPHAESLILAESYLGGALEDLHRNAGAAHYKGGGFFEVPPFDHAKEDQS